MRGLNGKYKGGWPNDPEIIAKRIIVHFLIRFAARSCPPMILESDNHAPIDLHKLFDSTVLTHIQEQFFEVSGQTFALQAYRHRDGRTRHDLHLCTNGRKVMTSKLRDLLPELPEKLLDTEQESYTLIVLVTGEYLDTHANQECTRIAFQLNDEPDLDDSLVSRQVLHKGISDYMRFEIKNAAKGSPA